jgi:hypothetical protein
VPVASRSMRATEPGRRSPRGTPSLLCRRCNVRTSIPARAQAGVAVRLARGLRDVADQDLAVLTAGHASSPSRKSAASFFDSTSKAAASASTLSLRCSCRSSSLTRRRSSRASAARGSPRPAIASYFHASNSAGYRPCSRHQALPGASSIAAVATTTCSRAAAVQRRLPAPDRSPDPLAKASPRQRSSGNSRATIRSLYRYPYRATSAFPRPQRFRSCPSGNFPDTGRTLSRPMLMHWARSRSPSIRLPANCSA